MTPARTALPLLMLLLHTAARADDAAIARKAEAERVAVVEKVRPSVVAVFADGGGGGGSGVVIDPEGYALTNFHVVEPTGPYMKCGLADGVYYDGVLVGLDKVGDVALIKLLPKTPGKPFPFTPLGDSDAVKPGDWSLAMGNPFLVAKDFTPTVTFGLVSGVNRYQYPSGGLLEYTDCIQMDTSINPGNSGGPLFSMRGEVIGINGRGSFDKRARINSGVGYAISSNQIKHFLGHLRAGIDTDHATLGATVKTEDEDGEVSRMVVQQILEDSDARRRGLDTDDELVAFAGRPVSSVNQYKNILGIFPKGWRMPLVYRRKDARKEVLVRLQGLRPGDRPEAEEKKPGRPPTPGAPAAPPKPKKDPPGKAFYKEKPGFANYYFNERERDRLLKAFAQHGDFTKLAGPWRAQGTFAMPDRNGTLALSIAEPPGADGKSANTVVKMAANVDTELEPLKPGLTPNDLREPVNSGGLLVALYHWRRLLTLGPKGFEGGCTHGGTEPFYPLPLDGSEKPLRELRVDTEVLRTEHAGVAAKWHFDPKDARLLGLELYVDDDADPCEVYFHDHRNVNGALLPHKLEVRFGDTRYALLTVQTYTLGPSGS